MPRPFVLPDLGEGLTEAEILKVLVNEGDVLAEDAPLLEVETDKATVEIPSPFGGRVARIHVRPGQSVKVGDVLVTFDDSAGFGARGAGRRGGRARRLRNPTRRRALPPRRPAPPAATRRGLRNARAVGCSDECSVRSCWRAPGADGDLGGAGFGGAGGGDAGDAAAGA